ncbi:MAG: pyridoxamine 5'-phosphate oxidase [Flavobacteriaceae bacterium]|nr:pyridoxamine 5'-phosphate oxidase [Flavobacteriaceae bacterium]
MENLNDKRQEYKLFQLLDKDVKETPMEQFHQWYLEADKNLEIVEANSMSVSTLDEDGCPSNRIILLKSFDKDGFVFYTNYESKKAVSIEKNKKACLHFFWATLERQVMIKATLERVPEEMSDEYFASRPRGSKLGAWASQQSKNIPSREYLAERLEVLEKEYEGKEEIPRPKHWGGYLARPYEIEFWQGGPNRLHDRILYTLQENDSWKISRLAP